jgi:hypothetical protein
MQADNPIKNRPSARGKGWGGSNLTPEQRKASRDRRDEEIFREVRAHNGAFFTIDSDESKVIRRLIKAGRVEENGKNASGRSLYKIKEEA